MKITRCQVQNPCIRHRHTGLSPGVMMRAAIGYKSRSPLVHVLGTLNRVCYISTVLSPVVLRFVRALLNATFQQNNS